MNRFKRMTTAQASRTRIRAPILVTLCLMTLPVQAEWYLDLSAGAAVTQEDALRSSNGGITDSHQQNFDPSWEVALRIGRWFPEVRWLGISTEWSFYEAENAVLEENLINTFSAHLMFRLSLQETEEHPDGKIQPYFGVGPGLFVSYAEADSLTVPGGTVKDATSDPGLDTRLGVAWMIEQNLGAFLEYRFTYFRARYEDFKSASGREDKIEADYLTHHLLLGISYRF